MISEARPSGTLAAVTPEQLAIVEAFTDPARRSVATHELAAFGVAAVPLLRALLDGTRKNRWGVPYAAFGEAVSCALVVCSLIGPGASELEPLVRERLRAETTGSATYAAAALGRMGACEVETIAALAACLDGEVLVAVEAGAALVRVGATEHPAVLDATRTSARASDVMRRVSVPC